jgi:hypothetical protein
MIQLPQLEEKRASVPRYSWVVVLCSMLGFVTSVAIHVTAYFKLIPTEIFLLYCRIEWVWVGFLALLLGLFMPTTRPRRQLLMLLRWLVIGCIALFGYALFVISVYVRSEHPRRIDSRYVVQQGGETIRVIGQAEYQHLMREQHRFYYMYLNRGFSLVWVILFFGISLHGIGYLRAQRRLRAHDFSPEKYVPWWYGGG